MLENKGDDSRAIADHDEEKRFSAPTLSGAI
jgi:hypothetical protein